MKDVDQSIAEKDILFIVNEAQRTIQSCDSCFTALQPDEVDEKLNSALQRYPSFEIPAPNPAEHLIHYPAVDEITCELEVRYNLRLTIELN